LAFLCSFDDSVSRIRVILCVIRKSKIVITGEVSNLWVEIGTTRRSAGRTEENQKQKPRFVVRTSAIEVLKTGILTFGFGLRAGWSGF
jgi:hypothetical protein